MRWEDVGVRHNVGVTHILLLLMCCGLWGCCEDALCVYVAVHTSYSPVGSMPAHCPCILQHDGQVDAVMLWGLEFEPCDPVDGGLWRTVTA